MIYKTSNDVLLATGINSSYSFCGHIFELIEYFYYFRFLKNVTTSILIPYNFSKTQFYKALDKYDFTEFERSEIIKNTTMEKVKVISANKILFVDGFINAMRDKSITIKCETISLFRCSPSTGDECANVLQDSRIYSDYVKNSIHYVKKILLPKYKKPNKCENNALLYGTIDCRKLTQEMLDYVYKKYHDKFDKILIVSDTTYDTSKYKNMINVEVPLDNIFEKFSTYIYTPITLENCSKMDCSPRFVVECSYFNKNVIYETDFMDKGLSVRKYDIENNFQKLILNENDNLLDLLDATTYTKAFSY